MLGDLPAKALRYQAAGLSGDDIVMAFQQFSSGVGVRVEFDDNGPTASYVYLWRL